jgi:thioredoxin-related protein
VLLAALLLLVVVPAHAAGPDAHGLAWMSWDAGLSRAAAADRPVLVDVYTDWCGYCRKMDREVYSREDVRDYVARHFVTVKINAESSKPATIASRRLSESAVASKFRVTGYPTTVFLKPNGEHLVSVPGYIPADRFLLLLRYIGDGHLERGVSFDDFVAKAGANSRAR